MSYDFEYDPESGETPWPLIWTVTPEKYNFEGTLGEDFINFTVEAIPDPDYPDAWEDYHTPDEPTGGGTGPAPEPPPLPPEPVLEEYIVHGDEDNDPQILSSQYINVSTANGLVIDNVDIRLLFPYQAITYSKDGQLKSANVPQEVIDDDFDFIVEFVPDERETIEKKVILEAVSNSTSTLKDTFWFLLNNDWSEAKTLLKDLAEISKQNIENQDRPEGGEQQPPNNNNEDNEQPFDPSGPEEEPEQESFEQRTGMTYDELFRKENPNEINTVIEETGKEEFINNLKEESQQEPEPELENPLLNEGSTADEILRNNTISDLVQKYNITATQVLEFLRNI